MTNKYTDADHQLPKLSSEQASAVMKQVVCFGSTGCLLAPSDGLGTQCLTRSVKLQSFHRNAYIDRRPLWLRVGRLAMNPVQDTRCKIAWLCERANCSCQDRNQASGYAGRGRWAAPGMLRGHARPKAKVPKQQQPYAEERGGAYRPSGAALTIQEVASRLILHSTS